MDYTTWNDKLGARFFNQNRIGARVFQYVTTEVVAAVDSLRDADINDFVVLVKTSNVSVCAFGKDRSLPSFGIMELL
jgi:hypothetical protein